MNILNELDEAGYGLEEVLAEYGSPLYLYSERVLRARAREMAALIPGVDFRASYSMKANGNPALLKRVRQEGLHVDAMSPGEIALALYAGFRPEEILFIPNNVGVEELAYAVERGVNVNCDSLSQLELYGRNFPGRSVSVRLNPGVGAGHHAHVVTGGDRTKFGIRPDEMSQALEIASLYQLRLNGLSQHIGSLFLSPEPYLEAAEVLLGNARLLPDLEWADFGGGFGVPYASGENRLDLSELGERLSGLCRGFQKELGRNILFGTEPGRYVTAESGILLGKVHAVKRNGSRIFAGTDIGFQVFARSLVYQARHPLELFGKDISDRAGMDVTVVGNICESGDILGEYTLPEPREGDVVALFDAGAYGYSMSSAYNARQRPAEVLLLENGKLELIRRRERLEDLFSTIIPA